MAWWAADAAAAGLVSSVYTLVCVCVCVYVGMFIMCRTGLECNKSNLQSCQQEAARATLTKTTTTTTTSIRKQQQCVMPHPLPNVVGSSLGATTKSVDLGPWGVFLCVGVGEYMYNTYIYKFYSTYYMYKLHICNLFSPHRYKASHCANNNCTLCCSDLSDSVRGGSL